jgi:hypothetical protein
VQELVIVLCDLYLSPEAPERELPAGVTLPGLQQAARYAARSEIAGGWRPWLARWLGGSEAGASATVASAPATVAAMGLQSSRSGTAAAAASSRSPELPPLAAGALAGGPLSEFAWIATPMHLIAGLTSVHVDRRSVLRLNVDDQAQLASDFQRVFHDSGFQLQPLDSGDFLMLGPRMPLAEVLEPARAMGSSVTEAQRADPATRALRRLGAEIEMWLHDHPVNDARGLRGQPPVTALWLWGGGAISEFGTAGAGDRRPAGELNDGATARASEASRSSGALGDAGAASADIAFGRDAYLDGLWAARAEKVFALPEQLADVFGYPQARRAVLVIELGLMLHSHPTWTFFDAVAHIDRVFISPAIEALNRGQCERLVILANDHQLTLRAGDRFKFWRRIPPGLSGLQ